jgi:hypothetical protein
MTPLTSPGYVQIRDIDDTANRLAYLLICKYRTQHVDGLSIMKGRLFQALLKYYFAIGMVFMAGFIMLVGLHYLPSDFLTITLIAMVALSALTTFFLKRDSQVAVYRCVIKTLRLSYDQIDRSLKIPAFNSDLPEPTLCEHLNAIEETVKHSAELAFKPDNELTTIYKSQIFNP